MKTRVWMGLVALSLAGIGAASGDDFRAASASLRAEDVLADIRILASDAFEGRGPGTPGEDKTVAYLVDRFRKIGLKPGNPDGRFVQDVPLVGFQASSTSGSIRAESSTIDLK